MYQIIKVGSGCHFDEEGRFDEETITRRAIEIKKRSEAGETNILVVSGAIAFGKYVEGEKRRNSELSAVMLQGYASLGQGKLYSFYDRIFEGKAAQVLVSEAYIENYGDPSCIIAS